MSLNGRADVSEDDAHAALENYLDPAVRAGVTGSIRCLGVTRAVVDVCDAKQEYGMTHWNIMRNADRKVSGASVQPGP